MKTVKVPIPSGDGQLKRVHIDLAPSESLMPRGNGGSAGTRDTRPVINEFRAPRGFLPKEDERRNLG